MNQAVPWAVAGVFAVAAIGIYGNSQGVIKAKDAELQAAEAKYQTLVNQSSAKARDADARIEAARTEAKRIATQANTQLDALAKEASAKIQAASLPEVPIAVSVRGALMGSGKVVSIKNMSRDSIAVTITATRASENQQRSFQRVIDSQSTADVGHAEGWAFIKGDVVQVAQANHKAKRFELN